MRVGMHVMASEDEWFEQSLIPLSLRSVYERRVLLGLYGRASCCCSWATLLPAASAGRLGLRLRPIPPPGGAPVADTTGRLGLLMRAGPEPNTEPFVSSSHNESMRDDRRPLDDAELRRDDRLAILPSARMAVPVF